jgi:hypothetical protein
LAGKKIDFFSFRRLHAGYHRVAEAARATHIRIGHPPGKEPVHTYIYIYVYGKVLAER